MHCIDFYHCYNRDIQGRDIVVDDIPGAFLQPKASNSTIIRLQGAVIKPLLQINPHVETPYIVRY